MHLKTRLKTFLASKELYKADERLAENCETTILLNWKWNKLVNEWDV